MILNTFLHYLCFASAIFIYGIGATKLADYSKFTTKTVLFFIKLIVSVSITSVLSFLIANKILVKIGMLELFPLVCFFVYACINILTEALVRITIGADSAEFIISYLIVLLSVSEGINLLDTIIIAESCIAAFIIIKPLVSAFHHRLSSELILNEKYYCRLFLFIALIIFIISAWDSMWINPEVIK